MDTSPAFLHPSPTAGSRGALPRAALAPPSTHSSASSSVSASHPSDGFSALTVTCVAGGAAVAAAYLTYGLMRRRMLQRDSPPAAPLTSWPAILAEQEQRRARRAAATAGANATGSTSSASAAGFSSSPVDLSSLDFRVPTAADAESVTVQTCDSFNKFNASVGLSDEFSSDDAARTVMEGCIANDAGLIAVRRSDGAIMGSVFNDETDIERGAVGCGPWSARWGSLHGGVGRELVNRIVSQSVRHGARSIRLIQIGANNASFALYSAMGFTVREPLMAWKGLMRDDFVTQELEAGTSLGLTARRMTSGDVTAADQLHESCNGISRERSILNDVASESSMAETRLVIVDAKGKVVAYSTGLGAAHHSVALSLPAMKFLYAAQHRALSEANKELVAKNEPRLYPELTRWMVASGMRASRQVNLMVLGEWQPIQHDQYVYSPSIIY